MLILWKARQKDPAAGYARTFLAQLEQVLGTCLDRGIKVVTNAGGLNPAGLADEVGKLAAALGLHRRGWPTSPATTCWTRSPACWRRAWTWPTWTPASGWPTIAGVQPVTANAYLGAWGIARGAGGRRRHRHLPAGHRRGADRGPGRLVAPLGPDRLRPAGRRGRSPATSSSAGPRPAAATTRSSSEITDRRYPGFPIAEVAADGSSVITKHDGTGGLVSVGTVTAQLLYEIDGPAYLGPDVVAHFDSVALTADGPGPGADLRGPRHPAAADAQGGDELPRRLPQHHDAGADRAGHRGEGGLGAGRAVRAAGRRGPVRAHRRPAAALRPARRARQRAGHRAPAGDGAGPGPAPGGAGVLGRGAGAGPGRLRRLPHDHAAHRGERVRGVLARAGPGGRGGADGRAARRQPAGGAAHPAAGRRSAGGGRGDADRPAEQAARETRGARSGAPPVPVPSPVRPGRPGARRSGWSPARGPATRAATPTWACGPATTRATPGWPAG